VSLVLAGARPGAEGTPVSVVGVVSEVLWRAAPPGEAVVTLDVAYLPLNEQPSVELVQGKAVLMEAIFPHTFIPRIMECHRLGAGAVIVGVCLCR
jgi:hypothetical protein